ncbi:hypothetical protein AB5J56_01530 [Streptomyces sp. R21]|uniref:Carboxypeptidase regulatory-like domain-containing protein n=1 Tax=Streptomyces sp. R21 TaxID=3238627 RepID=A0AB39NZI8_9ACTN
MPNELVFYAQQEVTSPEGDFLGQVRAAPYERLRVLAYCPYDAVGNVVLSLSHLEGEGVPGLLDRITLVAGSTVNQVYEVPGVVLGLSALATADAPTSVTVWIWGYRSEAGVPPVVETSSPPQQQEAELVVRAVLDDGAGGAGPSAGAGVLIRLDGVDAGATGADGSLTLSPPVAQHLITAVIPSMAAGEQLVTVEPGTTAEVTVVLFSGEIIEPVDLALAELVNGALPLDTPTVTLRFLRAGLMVPITSLYEVELRFGASQTEDLTSLFSATPEGAVAAVDAAAMIAEVVGLPSESRLRVSAADQQGFSYEGTVVFVPGVYHVQIQLEAPPSQPQLPVSGVEIKVRSSNGAPALCISDALGACELSDVPGNMLEVEATVEYAGLTYVAQALVAVDQDLRLLVRLLGLVDLANGVVLWEVGPATTVSARRPATSAHDEPQGRREAEGGRPDSSLVKILTDGASAATATATVNVAGGAKNAPITSIDTLQVPQGTKAVVLRYLVSTAEYPDWVMQQSRYNDTWGVQVRDTNGAMLFSMSRTVNSQLYGAPSWTPFGDTGVIQEKIDTTALAATADISLSVMATTTNIGDAALPTDVVAVLGAEPTITINRVTRDVVTPTVGASDRYSVPPAGESNTFQRSFDLEFSKPDEVEITKVTAELVSQAGAVLQTVVNDEAPGTPRVQQIDETTMRVVVTFDGGTSTVPSTPPPADRIHYRFTLTGRTDPSTEVKSEPKDSPESFALWHMPGGFARYGARDPGGDTWAAESTYTWLDTHRALITAIDDISGEHARNIGHQEHDRGTQVDMFHVYTFPGGGVSGLINYMQLQAHVERALAGDLQARTHVNTWASVTRTRFDSLIAEVSVQRIYYAIGSDATTPGSPALTQGWARALLTTGSYTNPGNLTLALPAGAWGNAGSAKLRFNAIHNSHIHLDL